MTAEETPVPRPTRHIKNVEDAGRPRKNDESCNSIHQTELYRVLSARLPEEVLYTDGGVRVRALAAKLELAYFTIYRWFGGRNISVSSARKLLKYSEDNKGTLTIEDLRPFIDSL